MQREGGRGHTTSTLVLEAFFFFLHFFRLFPSFALPLHVTSNDEQKKI